MPHDAADAKTQVDGLADAVDADRDGADVTAPPVGGLSDDFGGTTLDPSWTVFNASAVTVSVHDGALYLQPTRSILWYAQSQGVLVYKLVTGDFKATSTVHARLASNPTLPPNQNIHLGGVMARNPTSSQENYVLGVVGQAEMGHLAIEWKTTRDGASTFGEDPWPSADADIRLCRVGSTFQILKRSTGSSSWTLERSIDRPDLPTQLQVGPSCYANSTPPDLVVSFDEFLFEGVMSLSQCAQ